MFLSETFKHSSFTADSIQKICTTTVLYLGPTTMEEDNSSKIFLFPILLAFHDHHHLHLPSKQKYKNDALKAGHPMLDM